MRKDHVENHRKSHETEVNLRKIDGHGKFCGEHFLEAKGVQENRQTNSPNIEQQHPVNDPPMFVCDIVHVDHEIEVEAEKVLGPQVKELYHFGSSLVKFLIDSGSSIVRLSSIFEARNGEPRTHKNIRPKDVHGFNKAASHVGSQYRSAVRVVINGTKDCHKGKVNVFVHKTTR